MNSRSAPERDADLRGEARPGALDLIVWSMAVAAQDVLRLELRNASGRELPAFTPGSHIALHWSGGPARSYSLINPASDRTRYVVAVQLDAQGRGGSRFVHQHLRVGDTVTIGAPTNHFPLVEDAPASLLIAGGIGITPLWAMAQRLEELGSPWALHYAARNPRRAPLLQEVSALSEVSGHGRARVYFSEPDGGQPSVLPVADVVASATPEAHLYCCGPERLIEAFIAACRGRDPKKVHLERFTALMPATLEGGFTVRLARSGGDIHISPGQSILQGLIARGIYVAHTCEQGVCGSCEVRVLEGKPDHRDSILTESEQSEGKTMMVCCSRARTSTLVLDL